MSTRRLLRLAGIVLVLGGLFGLVGTLINPTETDPRLQVANALFLPANWLSLLGGILTLIAFPAVYARFAGRAGGVGLVGFVGMMTTAVLLGAMGPLINLVILPWVVEQPIPSAALLAGPPAFQPFFIVAGLIALVGAISFGIATIRSGAFSRWIGYLLIAAGLLNLIGFVPIPPGILGSLGGLCFYAALGAYGYDLWRRSSGLAALPNLDVGGETEQRAA